MSTEPEDNARAENTDRPTEGAPQPKFEPGVAEASAETGAPGTTEAPETEENQYGTAPEAEFGAVPAEPRTGGAFSTETLSIVSVVLLAVTILTGQLLEILTSMLLVGDQTVDPAQIRQIEMQVWMGGAVALLTVLTSTLALALHNWGTRPWAKWTATATTIVGLLFVIVAAAAFLLMPEASPQQMMPPVMD
ncbi:hypothetical protein GCM10007079_38790 [Nocardiopsis terrae]|uniref:Uncharacterized protein n=1 Tax=Nocardiopsis terrae TaxID=372655 RepID=A0ABR9HE06_9ACTN|nr:hypothetical protein [Nocardiopsis terrae]MBE1457265.1 hypothetical protein [Nocardiopsis terrae]GHC91459.1 hypothetical protein GCM10007079_38790 [Nocardiopsis terrae]